MSEIRERDKCVALKIIEKKLRKAKRSPVILSWNDAQQIARQLRYLNELFLGRALAAQTPEK